MRNGKVSSLSPFSPRTPRSVDSATGKRKQQTINQFFASKSPKRSNSPIVIEDSAEEPNHDITPKKEVQIDPCKNAFSLLLNNSKLLNKKLRALFILELSNGKLTLILLSNHISFKTACAKVKKKTTGKLMLP